MKFGLRTPSLRKSIAARTSVKRFVRHNIGLKAPKGYGWFTNPKKALYNRIYTRTTFSVWNGLKLLSFFGLQTKVSNVTYKGSDSSQNSINIVGVVGNVLALLIVGIFFIGLYDQAIDHYGSYYWTHGAKSDGEIGSGFTSIIMVLILLGFETNLWWVTLMFFGYVCYFFIDYYQVLFINIPLAYVILKIGIRKLGFTRNVTDKEIEENIDRNKFKVVEQKVNNVVDGL